MNSIPQGAPHGVAAPSANVFGRVSPTSLEHAADELADRLGPDDVMLDGGPSEVGVESTIVDCTGDLPRILRPGGVTVDEIAAVCDCTPQQMHDGVSDIRVPGSLPSHYAPRAQVIISPDLQAALALLMAHVEIGAQAHRVGLIAPASEPTPEGVQRLASPQGSDDYARSCMPRFAAPIPTTSPWCSQFRRALMTARLRLSSIASSARPPPASPSPGDSRPYWAAIARRITRSLRATYYRLREGLARLSTASCGRPTTARTERTFAPMRPSSPSPRCSRACWHFPHRQRPPPRSHVFRTYLRDRGFGDDRGPHPAWSRAATTVDAVGSRQISAGHRRP